MEQNQSLSVKQPQIKRHVATLITVKDILESSYVKQEGWEPNYLQTPFGENVFRVNIVGVVVEPPIVIEGMTQFSCTIDDGTGRIELRAFEKMPIASELTVGTAVLIIGKPREYNNIIYILPEIIKPIEKKWVEYRKAELEKLDQTRSYSKNNAQPVESPVEIEDASFSTAAQIDTGEDLEDLDNSLESEEQNDTPDILKLIDSLDSGDGVLVEDLKEHYEDAEDKVTRLLLHGEIFEIRPGRIKVLK